MAHSLFSFKTRLRVTIFWSSLPFYFKIATPSMFAIPTGYFSPEYMLPCDVLILNFCIICLLSNSLYHYCPILVQSTMLHHLDRSPSSPASLCPSLSILNLAARGCFEMSIRLCYQSAHTPQWLLTSRRITAMAMSPFLLFLKALTSWPSG